MLRRLSALPALVFIGVTPALAQFDPSALPNIEYNPILLINPSVTKELGLSPTRASAIQKAFFDDAMKLMPVFTGGGNAKSPTPEQRRSLMLSGVMHMQSHLAAMLTPGQRVRLRQLTLQSVGPAAVLQPKVASALSLTSSQKAILTTAISAANRRIATGTVQANDPRAANARLQQMAQLQAKSKVEGQRALDYTLTPAQKAKWRQMLGKPFALTGFLGLGGGLPGFGG